MHFVVVGGGVCLQIRIDLFFFFFCYLQESIETFKGHVEVFAHEPKFVLLFFCFDLADTFYVALTYHTMM